MWPRSAPALPLALLLLVAACRDSGTGPPPQTGPPFGSLAFAVGDSMTFDAWTLDPYGDVVVSSHATLLWRVFATGDVFAGDTGVTSVEEVRLPETAGGTRDTFRFRFLPSGDIEQYGFIASVVRRREGVLLHPSWDRIAAFSLPTNGVWNVGVADSAGLDTLRGTVEGDEGYFIASVNGVRTAVHGYAVRLSSLDIEFALVVASAPPAILLTREESSPIAAGRLRSLSSLIGR